MMELLFLFGGAVFLYVFLLHPQLRSAREHRELIGSLKVGDELITNAGIHGVVVELEDKVVWLEVAPGVELKILRSAVTTRIPQDEDVDDDTEIDDEDVDDDTGTDDEDVDDEESDSTDDDLDGAEKK